MVIAGKEILTNIKEIYNATNALWEIVFPSEAKSATGHDIGQKVKALTKSPTEVTAVKILFYTLP